MPVGPPPVRTHACASVGTRTGSTPRGPAHAAKSLTHAPPTQATPLARVSLRVTRVRHMERTERAEQRGHGSSGGAGCRDGECSDRDR